MRTVTFTTTEKIEIINVTETLSALVNGVEQGIAWFGAAHSTVALIICEDEADLRHDLKRVAEHYFADLRPFKHTQHGNPNAGSHLMSALSGTAVTLAIADGRPVLGTYQSILLVELDGPRERRINCVVIAS